jgi:hypothetical protein
MDHSGKLELTWTNKHLRLLSNVDGGYTWVPAADYRVAEVRLLTTAPPPARFAATVLAQRTTS